MSKLHVVAPLRTSFQVQNEIESAMAATVRAAYERGQESGVWLAGRKADVALGVGLCFGVAFGVIGTLLTQGWLT
jgi:hypothetical protein